MVLGYAPWCARSAELMPRFAEAATDLKEMGSKVLMTKIDGERYSKVASKLEIKGFPTLLLFVNGTSLAYTGGFTSEDIVIWVQKKIGAPTIKLNTVDEASRFLKKYHTFLVGLYEKLEGDSEHDEFVNAVTLDNEIQFVETSSSDVAKLLFPNLETKDVFVGLVKSEAERYIAYGKLPDVWIKSDDSPVTVADYGSHAVVSLVLERELKIQHVSLLISR